MLLNFSGLFCYFGWSQTEFFWEYIVYSFMQLIILTYSIQYKAFMLGGVILKMNKTRSLPCQESFKWTGLVSYKFSKLDLCNCWDGRWRHDPMSTQHLPSTKHSACAFLSLIPPTVINILSVLVLILSIQHNETFLLLSTVSTRI